MIMFGDFMGAEDMVDTGAAVGQGEMNDNLVRSLLDASVDQGDSRQQEANTRVNDRLRGTPYSGATAESFLELIKGMFDAKNTFPDGYANPMKNYSNRPGSLR